MTGRRKCIEPKAIEGNLLRTCFKERAFVSWAILGSKRLAGMLAGIERHICCVSMRSG
jgi:hypothetical protein